MDQDSHSFCVISDSLPNEPKKVEAYRKDLTFEEIYNLFNSGKIDTVFVRRSDPPRTKCLSSPRQIT